MNSYEQALRSAEEARRSHHEREARLTRDHYQRHPECAFKILAMDEAGYVYRGKTVIDVEARCRPGWFTRPMWTQDVDEGRPMEALQSQTRGYWYRVDDLRHADAVDVQSAPGTHEMGRLLRKALIIDKAQKEEDARHRAEIVERRRAQREARLIQRSYMMPLSGRAVKTGSLAFVGAV